MMLLPVISLFCVVAAEECAGTGQHLSFLQHSASQYLPSKASTGASTKAINVDDQDMALNTVVYNNLGGKGPMKSDPEELRFGNVYMDGEEGIDLVISVPSKES